MNEAGKMAEAAIVYKNVADGLDTIEASTESITSTMKAFGIESSGTMGIIDSFNEVGNNFAITSAGIGEALKRSASALDAGGNTLEESIGLITGANTVVQNPETVGTALKTLSLRIRGVKTELEEAGLETENMAETTSQLQAKLLALTHGKVDIMIDENNFKSTYQILEDMSKVWKEMTDVEQAAALELIGGKRQANILASLISNFEVAQNATETAANSAGSALKENEVYLDSIDGKTQLLTNSMQNLWNNAVSSEGVKMFLDIANAIVKVTDKVGLLNVAISGLFGYLSASGKNNFLKFFTFNTKDPMRAVESNWLWNGKGGLFEGLRVAFSQIQPNKDGAGKIFDTTGIKKYASEVKNLAAQQQGLSKVTALGTALTKMSSAEDIKKAATTKAVGVASTVASVGVSALNMALTMGLGLLVGAAITGVITLIDNAVHRAENIKQEVQELTDAYEEAKKSYSDNLDKLTTSSDTGLYSTLLDEFNALTQGVSKNGDNISLTSDQYERYRQICETICDVNPNLIAGYDSATEAIGNKASALEDLIAAQQEAARREAAEYTSDENIQKYAEDAMNDYEEAQKEIESTKLKLQNKFKHELGEEVYDSFNISTQADGGKELIRRYLENAGMSPEDINSEIEKYTNDITGEVDFGTWLSENIDYISEHISGYSNELQSAAAEYRDAVSDVATAQEGVINELLEVPVGLEEYKNLKGSEKSFITEWIKNSDMFKIDENTTAETVLGMKKTIKNIVQDITGGDYTTTVNGQQFTATDILESIFNFDTTGVDWGKYQERMNEYVDYLWDAIGGVSNEFGFKDKDALKLSLGIDFQLEDETKMIKRYVELKDVTADEAQDYFDSLPTTEVQRLLQVDWNVITNEDELDKILEPKVSTSTPVQTYSTIAAEVTKYTEALSQSKEVVSDNTVVTQDFYDSLVDLAGSEEKVAECFDAANPLMVKNAEALNEVVNEAERNVSANVELAQSQARLQYFELVQELNDVCNVTEDLTLKRIDEANAIIDQIDLVQDQIYKYQLLKETLSETGQAYTNFQNAQELDNLNTTGDNYVEMAQTIYDAFNVNGQVGTQAFDAAVEALIPDSVYTSLESDGDRLVAIYDYFNKKVLPSLTLDKTSEDSDEGTLSIDNVDVENFVEKGLNEGIFTGSAEDGLAAKIGMAYEEAAKKVGMTVNQFKAYLAELERYDYNTSAESFLSQFDQSFDGQVSHVTSKMQELNEEKMRLLSSDGGYEENKERIKEINKELGTCDKELKELQTEAVESYEKFANNQQAIEGLETIEDKTRLLTKEEANILGLKWDKVEGKTVQETLDLLNEKKLKLGEPTELQIQFAREGIINDVDSLIAEIEKDKKINIGIKYNKDKEEYEVDEDSKYASINENGQIEIKGLGEQGEALESSLNTFDSINSWLDDGLVTTETLLEDIKSTLNSLYKETTGKDAPGSEKKENSSKKIEDNSQTSRFGSMYEKQQSVLSNPEMIIGAKIQTDGDVEELKRQLESLDDETIEIIAKVFGTVDVEKLKAAMSNLDSKTIKAIAEAIGTGDVERLKDIFNNLDDKQVKAIAEAFGYDDVEDLKVAIGNMDGKTVQAIAEAFGATDVEGLTDAVNNLDGKTVEAIAEVYGKSGVEGLKKSVDDLPKSKTVSVRVNAWLDSANQKIKDWLGLANGTAHIGGTAHASGTAHAGGKWGAKKTETALTGELGPEMIVRGNRWFTVGDNGAEFTDIQKGDIIFNHKQTEELLKNGYVTSRGKLQGGSAHAQGTAYALWSVEKKSPGLSSSEYRATKKGKSKSSSKDSKDEFEEVFDWFEVKIEEINEDLDLMAAKLENAVTIKGKNNILNDMIATNKSELKTLEKGYKLYNSYADDILKQKKKNKDGSYSYIIPKKYWDEVKDGKVAIEEFYGSVDEKTLEQIKNYREWAQKAADLKQQIQEVKREITELAKQKFDNISEKYDNIEGLQDSRQQHYVDMADYRESKGWINSGEYYEAAMSEEKKKMKSNKNEKKRLQASLDNSVKKGHIKKYSAEWYEMVNAIHAVDSAIDENKANIEDYQNQINEIHFENFEKGLFRVSRLADETQSLIDIMSDADDFEVSPEGDVEWTDEGITKMGLYAQNMENYKKQNELYAAEIDNVNQMYKDGKISYQEYLEKLDELKNGQADSVKGYKDNKAAIEDMQKARVDAIKDGIDKEIEAYSELIDKKKEELSAEKDLYDFQKQVTEQRKSASDIERQLAALSGDNSASAMAKRKKLEAELAQARQELNDSYYDRSVEKQQEALDSEFEQYEELREKEKEDWDKWLENVDGVFDDAVETVKNSGTTISTTLAGIATDWDLQINTHIKTPWTDAATALSTTSTELDGVTQKFQDAATAADGTAQGQIDKQKEQNQDITDEVKDKFQKGETAYATKGTQVYDAKGKKTFKTGYNVAYTVVSTDNSTGMTKVKNSKGEIRYIKTSDLNKTETDTAASLGTSSNSKDKGVVEYYKKYTGKSTSIKDALNAIGADGSYNNREKIAAANDIKDYKGTTDQNEKMLKLLKQGKLKRYAVGSKRINKNQLAWLDELGEELQIVPNGSGRLDYVKKGTGIIPADMTERLMDLAMNPQDMLDRNRPSVGVSPEVHNTEINLNIQYGDMLKIENFKGDNPDEIAKIVAKQFEKHTKDLNNALRKYVR